MDLLNNEPKIEDEKNKKIMKLILIMAGILVVISIVLVFSIAYLKATVLKVVVDGQSKSFSEDFFVFQDNTIYVPIKEFARDIVAYDVQNGEYQKNTEDKNKCYIESVNEVTMFALGTNVIYKTKPNDTNYESFTIEQPVKNINNKLYISAEGISIACNVSLNYIKENNQIVIKTLPKLVTACTQTVTDKKYGYSGISEDFSSQKAILQGLIVVYQAKESSQEKETSKKYGVINMQGEVVIGTKYDKIAFIESTKEFLVTNNDKVGVLSANGDVKISLDNDELQLLDNDLKLYLATSNEKKGVLDEYGKVILYKEYDDIGVDTTLFPNNNIVNKYILFDRVIPVKKDGKYGLYDKNGNEILPIEYSGLGYVKSTTKDKSVNNLLIIPEYEGIILSKEYGEEKEKVKKYGIVNSLGEEMVPFGLEEIYSITSQGKDKYFVVYQGKELSLNDIKFNQTSSSSDSENNLSEDEKEDDETLKEEDKREETNNEGINSEGINSEGINSEDINSEDTQKKDENQE